MDQVKFVEDRQPLKNFTWPILEYNDPNDISSEISTSIAHIYNTSFNRNNDILNTKLVRLLIRLLLTLTKEALCKF